MHNVFLNFSEKKIMTLSAKILFLCLSVLQGSAETLFISRELKGHVSPLF